MFWSHFDQEIRDGPGRQNFLVKLALKRAFFVSSLSNAHGLEVNVG